MIIDANLLLYAADRNSPFHAQSENWLSARLNGNTRVGLPWQSLAAFQRIITRFRATGEPLTPEQAWDIVEGWLDAPAAWIPLETEHHRAVLGGLIGRYSVRGDLITDTRLAALAIEHGVAIASADTDFARFSEIEWINPLSAS